MLLLKDKWLARLFLLAAYTIDYSIQQDDGSDDTPDDGSDGTDDGSGDGSNDGTDDDECSLISGHSCNPNGICKYCAMCIQSSCILTKSSMPTATCNATQLGTPDVYDWYNYCLSSGNDSGGGKCKKRTTEPYKKETSLFFLFWSLFCLKKIHPSRLLCHQSRVLSVQEKLKQFSVACLAESHVRRVELCSRHQQRPARACAGRASSRLEFIVFRGRWRPPPPPR
ncbi:hypothetical protein BCR43DRAFT_298307 [Syncephalastrum racemosum]|uniref:Uncharacterized protein n=1 Tax=Syncephalastrum racemosum TaxID=13706 RepID=A0A1X2H9L7_SYNRA|nr:hypothetical protein BCR43DRAFT_298307 [Syncephalastrum racemosum]